MGEPNVGRCGHQLGRPPFGGAFAVCKLPAGHAGWHRSDEGTEWGIPAAGPYNALLKREKDIYERGVAAGHRQAADAIGAAKRRLYARIIANAHLLDKPFTDEPDLAPWDLLKREMAALDRALAAPAEPVERWAKLGCDACRRGSCEGHPYAEVYPAEPVEED